MDNASFKGPGSAYSGRGSTGGTINMVSKKPRADNAFAASAGLGADDHRRATADVKKNDRWGLAPSVTWGMDGPTRATLSHYTLRADDIPDQGRPMNTGLAGARGEPVRVRRGNFYGIWGRDKRCNEADITTLELEHGLANGWQLRNVTRDGESINKYIMSRPTINAADGRVVRGVPASNRKSETFANQTDLTGSFSLAGRQNDFAIGLEYSKL